MTNEQKMLREIKWSLDDYFEGIRRIEIPLTSIETALTKLGVTKRLSLNYEDTIIRYSGFHIDKKTGRLLLQFNCWNVEHSELEFSLDKILGMMKNE